MAFKKGQIAWNKGLKRRLNTGRTHFEKGFTPWNKGKKTGLIPRSAFKKNHGLNKDNKHPLWKGDNAGIRTIHKWIVRKLGQPTICEKCGIKNLTKQKIHWSNKDHKYKRNLEDWQRLCRKCHKEYDKQYIR